MHISIHIGEHVHVHTCAHTHTRHKYINVLKSPPKGFHRKKLFPALVTNEDLASRLHEHLRLFCFQFLPAGIPGAHRTHPTLVYVCWDPNSGLHTCIARLFPLNYLPAPGPPRFTFSQTMYQVSNDHTWHSYLTETIQRYVKQCAF